MKKWSSLLGALLLSVTLGACGGGGDAGGSATSSAGSSSANSVSSSSSSSSDSSASSSSSSSVAGSAVTLHMLGDSTMTIYASDRRPQMGWGEAMQQFFDSNVTVKNWAKGGRSSRSFYYETGMWDAAKAAINSGDYVIIQFGHNDQKYGGDYATYGTYAYCSDGTTDGEACAGAADAVDGSVDKAEHSYYQFLKKYVAEIRAKGAHPILMTPIVRNYQEGGDIRADGQHDWSAKVATGETSPRGNYPAAMKAVATQYSVPLVDLTAETRSIVLSYGVSAATDLYISADSTHPQVLFANLIAKKAVEGMKSLDVLKDNMVAVTSLITSPDTLSWGNRYVGITSSKTVTVSAFDLTPAAGTVVVTSPSAAFELSTDQTNWASSLNIDYSNGAFTKTIHVRFTPDAVQDYSGNIALTLSGSALGSVAVSGAGVAAGAGMDSFATWFTAGTVLSPVTDGLVTANDVTLNNLEATTSKTLAVDGQDTTVARFAVNTWNTRDDSKYLEFAVSPTGTFAVDTISAYLATSGGSTVVADMEYSVDGATWTKLNAETMSFTKDTMVKKEFGVTASVASGTKIFLRVYPWNTSGGATVTGKSIALYAVKIAGKVSN